MGVKSWTDIKSKKAKWRDSVEWLELKSGKWLRVRPVGGVLPNAVHWFRTPSGKNFALSCANFDPDTESWLDQGCPACEAKIRASRIFYQNVIDRRLQKSGDPNPVRLWEIGVSMSIAVRKTVALLNEEHYEDEDEMCGPEHPKKGCDLRIQYDKQQPSTNRYACQMGNLTKLSKEERGYDYYDIEEVFIPDSIEDLVEAVNKHCPEDEDDDFNKDKKSRRSKKSKKKLDLDDDVDVDQIDLDDDDDDDDDDDEEEEEEEEGTEESSFDEDFEGEEEEEEEEEPPQRRSKTKSKPKTSSTKGKKKSERPDCYGEYNKKSKKCKSCPSKWRFDCMDEEED